MKAVVETATRVREGGISGLLVNRGHHPVGDRRPYGCSGITTASFASRYVVTVATLSRRRATASWSSSEPEFDFKPGPRTDLKGLSGVHQLWWVRCA